MQVVPKIKYYRQILGSGQESGSSSAWQLHCPCWCRGADFRLQTTCFQHLPPRWKKHGRFSAGFYTSIEDTRPWKPVSDLDRIRVHSVPVPSFSTSRCVRQQLDDMTMWTQPLQRGETESFRISTIGSGDKPFRSRKCLCEPPDGYSRPIASSVKPIRPSLYGHSWWDLFLASQEQETVLCVFSGTRRLATKWL